MFVFNHLFFLSLTQFYKRIWYLGDGVNGGSLPLGKEGEKLPLDLQYKYKVIASGGRIITNTLIERMGLFWHSRYYFYWAKTSNLFRIEHTNEYKIASLSTHFK